MKNVLITIGIIFVIINVIACSGAGVDSSKAEKVADGSSTYTTTEKPVDQVFKVGEAVKLGNAELTVLSMEKTKGGQYDEKKPGMEFIIVNVKLKNVSKNERVRYDPLDFKIENSQGVLNDHAYLSILEQDSSELASGAEITGKVAFEVPIDDKKLTLEYRENMFLDDVIRVALNY